MSEVDANVDLEQGQPVGTHENFDEPSYSDVELAAMKKGWNPDKDAVPEGKEWITAGEFLRNESFFEEIRKLKRANKSIQKSFDVLKEHHKKVAEVERTKIIEDLKRQKKLALEEDDHDAVVEIDDKISDLKAERADPVEMQEQDNGIFDSWVEENPWYETNEEMRQTADDIGNGYFARMQGKVSPQQVYDHVTATMKKVYPEEFGAAPTRKKVVAQVEGARGSRAAKPKSKFTARDLNDEQRKVMNTFVRSGALTEEQYINELVRIGELG